MRLVQFLVSFVSSLLAQAGLWVDPDELAFAPAAGTELEKSFGVQLKLELDRSLLLWRDQDLSGLVAGHTGFEVVSQLKVVDEYQQVRAGRPTRLVRWYETLHTVYGWERKRETLNPLLARGVIFEWDIDRQEFDVDWALPVRNDRMSDSSDLLARLYEDLDLRGLLPPGIAARPRLGQRWRIPSERLASIAMPAGDVHRDAYAWSQSQVEKARDLYGQELREWLLDERFDGAVECEVQAFRSSTGERYADISIDVEWRFWNDLAQALEAWDTPFGSFERVAIDLDARGHGWLTWNLSRGHFESFELDLDVDFLVEVETLFAGETVHLELDGCVLGHWDAQARRR